MFAARRHCFAIGNRKVTSNVLKLVYSQPVPKVRGMSFCRMSVLFSYIQAYTVRVTVIIGIRVMVRVRVIVYAVCSVSRHAQRNAL
jgi:hypothetical protein